MGTGTAQRPSAAPPQPRWGIASFPAIGTTARVLVTSAQRLGDAVEAVSAQLEQLDDVASRFRADSEVAGLASGQPTAVSPLLLDLVQAALRAARRLGTRSSICRPSTQDSSSNEIATLVVLPAPGGAISSALGPDRSASRRSGKTSSIGSAFRLMSETLMSDRRRLRQPCWPGGRSPRARFPHSRLRWQRSRSCRLSATAA